MKILYISKDGLYDHQRTALRQHTKLLGEVTSILMADLEKTRVDNADVIIYFDTSSAYFYSHMAFSLPMMSHGAAMGPKGIKGIVVTSSGNPGEKAYRIWSPSDCVTEIGQLGEAWYAFHSEEVRVPAPAISGEGFRWMDWRTFEERFLLDKPKK